MEEIKVYIIDASEKKASSVRDWEYTGDYEKIISLAEELGTVYSLRGFQDAINDEDLDLNNSWIYFSNLINEHVPTNESQFKVGTKVRFKNDSEIYTIYAVYSDTMVSLGLLEYPDTEQDTQVNVKELEIV